MLTLVALFLVFIFSAFLLQKWSAPTKMDRIPGSMGWPFVGESFSFLSDFSSPAGIFSFMQKRQQRYGREAGSWPHELASTDWRSTQETPTTDWGASLTRWAEKYFTFINKLAVETLDHWCGRKVLVLEEASTVDLWTCDDFTLKVIGHMIMGLEPTGEEQEKFRANFKIISSCFASLPFKIPGTAFYRGIKARDRMYAMLDSTIAQRRKGESFQQDFLESLLKKHSKDGSEQDDDNKLTDKQLKDNILTLLVAGHDTTTAALTWLIKFLEENPAALERLREEHQKIRSNREDGTSLTWAEVNNMPYTAKVISETLRKATILPWFSRKAAQDFDIDGYEIQKGWSVNLDVVSIHHDPEIFRNPEKFDPSRFDEPLKPFSFLGFGSGPRMCPGINLAKLEISVFIHHLVCRYRWRPLEKDDSVQPTLVRMPKNKYPVVVESL
ncbi:UNVERIFIED_CONTAM: Abscisic acid 8'-hydroxylase 3 [Sesamum calycinum]|uniref:Abscisic acid 8'-hydroxylase 3 n=1 Tax=Sesamum calycinum TaxID=2727403 RepID=A0AAW2PA46_9LAMI